MVRKSKEFFQMLQAQHEKELIHMGETKDLKVMGETEDVKTKLK